MSKSKGIMLFAVLPFFITLVGGLVTWFIIVLYLEPVKGRLPVYLRGIGGWVAANKFWVILALLLVFLAVWYSFLLIKRGKLKKYFHVYKPHEFTVEEAARLFNFPAANKRYYERESIKEAVNKYVAYDGRRPGLLFCGTSGVGKSRPVYQIAVKGLFGRAFENILVPRTVDSLKTLLGKEAPKLPMKSVLILDDVERHADASHFEQFVERNDGRCVFLATVRSEHLTAFEREKGLAEGAMRPVARYFHKVEVNKVDPDECAAAAEKLGDEAVGYNPDSPPDTFSELVKDMGRQVEYYENNRSNAKGMVLEALALAQFSGYILPPERTEVPGLISVLYPNAPNIDTKAHDGVNGLCKDGQAEVVDNRVLCRGEFLSEVYRRHVRTAAGVEGHTNAAMLRTDLEKGDFTILTLIEVASLIGERDLAVSVLYSAIDLFPNVPEVYFSAGNIYKEDEPYRSEIYYTKALDLREEYPEGHNNYALLLEKFGRYDEAEVHYRRALELREEDPEVHNNYAVLLVKVGGRGEEAEGHYKRALELREEYPEAHYNYANFLNKLGRNREAEDHFKRALDIREEFPEVHVNYALMLDNLGRDEEAEVHYHLALVLREDVPEAHNNYAILLAKIGGRDDEAEGHYRRALELREEYPEAHNNYGLLLNKLRRRGEAEGHYKRALTLREEYPEAHTNYANLLVEIGKRDGEAEDHYRRAIDLKPDYANVIGAYADFLARRHRCDEAREYAGRFFDLAPDHSNVPYLRDLLAELCPEE